MAEIDGDGMLIEYTWCYWDRVAPPDVQSGMTRASHRKGRSKRGNEDETRRHCRLTTVETCLTATALLESCRPTRLLLAVATLINNLAAAEKVHRVGVAVRGCSLVKMVDAWRGWSARLKTPKEDCADGEIEPGQRPDGWKIYTLAGPARSNRISGL